LKPSNSRLLRRMLPSPPPHHHRLKAYPKVRWEGQEHPQHIVCRRKRTPASCGPWAWGPVLRPVRRGDGSAVLGPRSVGGGMKEESPARWAAGAAARAPAVRRRENLRSASFRDYAMAEVTPHLQAARRRASSPVKITGEVSERRITNRTGPGMVTRARQFSTEETRIRIRGPSISQPVKRETLSANPG